MNDHALILAITVIEKFVDGGWLTLLFTTALVVLCFSIRRHYAAVGPAIARLDVELALPTTRATTTPMDVQQPSHRALQSILRTPLPSSSSARTEGSDATHCSRCSACFQGTSKASSS